jgi:hypothetical protein
MKTLSVEKARGEILRHRAPVHGMGAEDMV